MAEQDNIRTTFDNLINSKIPIQLRLGKVDSVDWGKRLCDILPLDEEDAVPFQDVRLTAQAGNQKGCAVRPMEGSYVIFALIGKSESKPDAVVITTTELDEWLLSDEGISQQVDFVNKKIAWEFDEFTLNGGNNGGIIIVQKLVQDLAKIVTFIETFQNVLVTPIPEAGNGALSAFQQALNSMLSKLEMPTFQQITNDKIKH